MKDSLLKNNLNYHNNMKYLNKMRKMKNLLKKMIILSIEHFKLQIIFQ